MPADMMILLPDLSLQHAGLSGAAIYMTTYTLLATRVLSADSIWYFMMNLTAACLVLTSLSHSFNAATLVIQIFWILVSTVSIAVRLRRTRPSQRLKPLA